MSTILSIETATPVCSIALHSDGKLLGSQNLFIEKSHSVYLNSSIDHLVSSCGMKLSQIEAVALSKGPGSYTGLRIGTSTAKGLCYALDIPLIAVNTLEAMALGISPMNFQHSLLCPMIDARRMEVYCLIMDAELNMVEGTTAKVIDESSFSDLFKNHSVIFFGNGSGKIKDLFSDNEKALFVDDVYPSAIYIGEIARQKYDVGDHEDVAYFEPFYLKDFIAKKPSVNKLG
jgi:tRNA threonylcarbamoyladenosine biosynthesis protein TsaB